MRSHETRREASYPTEQVEASDSQGVSSNALIAWYVRDIDFKMFQNRE